VRVVTLTEELNDSRHLLRGAEEEKSESSDGRSTNIVGNVGNGDVKEFANSRV